MSIPAFPKIFNLGDKNLERLFIGEVEITEKIDGSQIAFGRVNGNLFIRSKGAVIKDENGWVRVITESDLFYPAIQHIERIKNILPDDVVFYGETLAKPKHNTLKYDYIPKNHIALFGILYTHPTFNWATKYKELTTLAYLLDVDVVPLITTIEGGHITPQLINSFLDAESYLGGAKIEGVVIKNYNEQLLIGGQVLPILCGKYVSEAFKEVHRKNWSSENTSGGKYQKFLDSFRTEARWQKAIQYVRDKGELTNTPKDIGNLIKVIGDDIVEEEKEYIKEQLFKLYSNDITRNAIKGFPEWYKQQLMESQFEN